MLAEVPKKAARPLEEEAPPVGEETVIRILEGEELLVLLLLLPLPPPLFVLVALEKLGLALPFLVLTSLL